MKLVNTSWLLALTVLAGAIGLSGCEAESDTDAARMTIHGQVYLGAMESPTLTARSATESYRIELDGQGRYQLELAADEADSLLLQVEGDVSGGRVAMRSQLPADLSNEGTMEVGLDTFAGTYVSPFSEAQLAAVSELSSDDLLHYATAMKLVVDGVLAADEVDLQALGEDVQALQDFVALHSQGGYQSVMAQGLESLENDPLLALNLRDEMLDGVYLTRPPGPDFLPAQAMQSLHWDGSQMRRVSLSRVVASSQPAGFYGSPNYLSETQTLWNRVGRQVFFAGEGALARSLSTRTLAPDSPQYEEFADTCGTTNYVTAGNAGFDEMTILSVSESTLLTRTSQLSYQEAATVECQGETFEFEASAVNRARSTEAYVALDYYAQQAEPFDIEDHSLWFLPVGGMAPTVVGFAADNTFWVEDVSPLLEDEWLVDGMFWTPGIFFSFGEGDMEGNGGTWELSDDQLTLTLRWMSGTLGAGALNLGEITDFMPRELEYEARLVRNGDANRTLMYRLTDLESGISTYGLGPTASLTESPPFDIEGYLAQFEHPYLVSMVNPDRRLWQGRTLLAHEYFGWYLGSDGSGELPVVRCDDERHENNTRCAGELEVPSVEALNWSAVNGGLRIDRYQNTDVQCDGMDTRCQARRYIYVQGVTDDGFVYGVEWQSYNDGNYRTYLIEPRPMQWKVIEYPWAE